MKMIEMRSLLTKFINSPKDFTVLTAIAAGLYPIIFYYSRNFNMVNSWGHIGYFIVVYLLFPILIFVVAKKLARLPVFVKYEKYVLPFLNIFSFLFILKTFLYVAPERKIIVGIFIVAFLFARFLYKHLKKVVVIQLILALIGLFTVGQEIYAKAMYSKAWQEQPDNIEDVVFKKKPNVYFIEPDGYVSFSELKAKLYRYDNSKFEGYLKENNFKTYPGFRTNYNTTLASNGATFMMKHHYFDFNTSREEVEDAKVIIISDNPVLNAFKRNGYETYFLSESHYFLLNRPVMGYDHSNIDYSVIPYLHNGMDEEEEVLEPFFEFLNDGIDSPKFFFIQILKPWHVSSHESTSEGIEVERVKYFERLEVANDMIAQMADNILSKDPGALIVIMADHGGSVGLDYTMESQKKTLDKDIINSIYSTNLTIHWPNNEAPKYDNRLKSNVNMFRVLFSYLSENENYIQNLQPDTSFIVLNEGTESGVYKYFDASGNIVFEKMEPE